MALAAPSTAAAVQGDVSFMRNATSSFDSVVTNATQPQQSWMQQHYDRFRAYPPFFDRFLSWAPPADLYIDAYAIYQAPGGTPGTDLIQNHPDWVLRDSAGKKLYIPSGCGGGTCPQYAADFGNPGWRSYFIDFLRSQLARGYDGAHIDDVNLEMRVGDGSGNFVRPIDPRTGAPMTDSNWNRYMADFMVQIRNAFPGVNISQNPLWFAPHSDPSVQRQTDAADVIEMERGFNDRGLNGGNDRFSYTTYLDHVDWLHARGKSVVFEPYDLDAKSANFEVASYLLVKEREDMITSDFHANPGDWWSGWDVNLGSSNGARYGWQGLIRRDFANGLALVNKPDAPPITVSLSGDWTDLSGNRVSGSITLGPRQGVALRSAGTTSTEPPPVTTEPPIKGSSRMKLKLSRTKVRKGSTLRIRGRGGLPGASVAVRYRTPDGWRTLKHSRARHNGAFAAKVRAARTGALRLRAAATDGRRSRVVRVRVV